MAQAKVVAGLAVAMFSIVTVTSAHAGLWGNSDTKAQESGKSLVQKVYDPEDSYKDNGSSDDQDGYSSSGSGYGGSYKPRGGYGDGYDRGDRYGNGSGYGYEPSYIKPYAVVKKLNNHGYYKVEFLDKTPPSYKLYGCKNGMNYQIKVNGWGNIVSSDEIGYCNRRHRLRDWWRSHRPW